MEWWHISLILCAYGFLKEFRPSEPFISPFLIEFKNLTAEQVNEEMYPVGTYAYLSLLIVVFLLTDFLRYKPILIAGSISGVITWSLLIWGKTIRDMQVVEFFYGFFMASEIAYYTYIYAKVDKDHYKKVTSHTRSAFLLGKAGAGLSSQILVYFKINYLQLNYFTVFGVGSTILLALFLPSAPQSLYFHRKNINRGASDEDNIPVNGNDLLSHGEVQSESKWSGHLYKRAFLQLYKDFKEAFTNLYVLQWSIWWALATCGYLQVSAYGQLLWQNMIENEDVTLYHGYVEFAGSIAGAIVAFAVGYLNVPWNIWGEVSLGILTLSQGGFLLYSSYLNNLYIAYAMYIAYKLFYDAAITVATFEVAKFINEDSYALVFGINTFLALVIQTILTAVVITAMKVDIRTQFQIYGSYHFVIGTWFLIYGIIALIFFKRRRLVSN